MYYDINGNHLDLMDWARLVETRPDGYGIIGRAHLGGCTIMTDWFGIDMSWGAPGPPLIFETMVFAAQEEYVEGIVEGRWATVDAARAGHDQVVMAWRERLGVGTLDPEFESLFKEIT